MTQESLGSCYILNRSSRLTHKGKDGELSRYNAKNGGIGVHMRTKNLPSALVWLEIAWAKLDMGIERRLG